MLKSPQIKSSCYYVYKQLPRKDVQNLEKQEMIKHLSGYKQCYTTKIEAFEVYMNAFFILNAIFTTPHHNSSRPHLAH